MLMVVGVGVVVIVGVRPLMSVVTQKWMKSSESRFLEVGMWSIYLKVGARYSIDGDDVFGV